MQSRRQEATRVAFEAAAVAGCGLLIALLANALSPRGLSLTRDYFPAEARKRAVPPGNNAIAAPLSTQPGPTTPPAAGSEAGAATAEEVAVVPEVAPSGAEEVAARLQARGLQLVAHEEAVELFQHPDYRQELIVFVDARDDRHYREGHIPGAYQFDHYYPENYLPTVLPACFNARRVVVYCTGGDCEDSEFAAAVLKEAGVPEENLGVYAGGMTEWRARALPIETGTRLSGEMLPAGP